jgi:hypothetical protein
MSRRNFTRVFAAELRTAPSQYRERFYSVGAAPIQPPIQFDAFKPELGIVA